MPENSLRILQILRAPVGGLFRHVVDLTHELSARGHGVGVIADTLVADEQTEAKLAALAKIAELGVHRFPIPRLLGTNDLTTPFRIRKLARSLQVDILHGHGAKGGFNARLARIGLRDCKALYTPHGGALHFDQRKPAGAVFMAIERRLLGLTDTLLFESDYARTVFFEKVCQPACPSHVIYNGLGAAEFDNIEVADDAADFVFVGELRLLKGIDLLVEALVPLKRPDGTPATLVMAGDGPDAKVLLEKIHALGLQDRVTLAGVQPARSMFARGHAVVVPSRAESLPYIVLEASAAGRPLIATAVGGIGEIFGPTARALVHPDSVSALQTAMAEAIAAPHALVGEAQVRRKHVQEQFSASTMVDRIEAVYRALAS